MVGTVFTGFGLGMGLIAAIGAQNVYVLDHGIGQRHMLAVPLVCFGGDLLLMSLGVCGAGAAFSENRGLGAAAAAAGALFLTRYGFRAAREALRGTAALSGNGAAMETRRAAVLGAFAVTFLNPHVYVDSLVLMGGIGARYPFPERGAFLAGVLAASFVWFFGLSLFGALLAPILSRPRAWRILQGFVCAMLWRQAADLAGYALAR